MVLRTVLASSALLALAACSAPGGYTSDEGDGPQVADDTMTQAQNADDDGDGLTNAEEAELGTDPDSADTDGDGLDDAAELDEHDTDPTVSDTDGDGFDDGEEIDAETNPNFEFSHPYAGDYAVGWCSEVPSESTGPTGTTTITYQGQQYSWTVYAEGDTVENLIMQDSHGEDFALYSFCGKTVLMALAAGWCGPCQSLAAELPGDMARYKDRGFTALEVLTENSRSQLPSQSDLAGWSSAFGLAGIPVVGPESSQMASDLFAFEADGYIPTTVMIGPDMKVLSMDEGAGQRGGPSIDSFL